jgi:hypothetical protein
MVIVMMAGVDGPCVWGACQVMSKANLMDLIIEDEEEIDVDMEQ